MRASKNIEMLAVVARALRDLKHEVVFVGGATVDIYVDESTAPPLRATDDVDCVIEIASRMGYRQLEKKLVTLGFKHPIDEPQAPICRWKLGELKVDIMPTSEEVLGFSNRWYSEGMAKSMTVALPDGQEIRVLTLPYFVATKIEAFRGRGKGDYLSSPDIEDILAVTDGATDFTSLVAQAPTSVRDYLKTEIARFLSDQDFIDNAPGHLAESPGSMRVERLFAALRAI
ncbi:hypothetical protein ACFL2T_05310 [Elusimicrobiota bacterium]